MVKYAIKVKTYVNHPARSVIQDDWTNHYGKFTQHTHNNYNNKVKPFFDLHNYTCIHKQLTDTPPWQLKHAHVDTTLSNLLSKKDNPLINKQIASQHIDSLYSN